MGSTQQDLLRMNSSDDDSDAPSIPDKNRNPSNETPYKGAMNIATISAGFEKADFLVREEKGQAIYFNFFEEAFNYISNKGFMRMEKDLESDWFSLLHQAHYTSIEGGTRYTTGKLLMVFWKPVDQTKIDMFSKLLISRDSDLEGGGAVQDDMTSPSKKGEGELA